MERQSKERAQQLATLIERNHSEIERRWLEVVQLRISGTKGVELTHLRDGLPDYLRALVVLLRGGPDLQEGAEPAWSKVAREHGITRVRIGFDINQLIQEFIVLRHVIREIAREQGIVDPPDALLADVLDQAIARSVGAYVDARDFRARQKHAESIGFLTHELRNPLSSASMAASRLRQRATPEQLRLLDTLDRSQRRLSELIDSVLLTERLGAGKVEYRPAELTLERLMVPALEAARTAAANKGLGFAVRYDPELRVRLDPALTRSAIQNLADNAVKYADHGHVEISVDDSADDLVIHVRDTCEGISEEELSTIFEPFERGTTGKSGTGLGLAIAQRAVQAQGGSIQAESREATGCHFWIKLPKRGLAK